MKFVKWAQGESSLDQNIPKLYILRALQTSWVVVPTLVVFFQDHGLTLKDVLLLKAVLSVAVLLLEVPSGYFADIFGRKNTLLVAGVFWCGSTVAYCLGSNFQEFLVAEMLLGITVSLISGADTAMVYDTLKAGNHEEQYLKVEGRMGGIAGYSEATGGLIGAWLASLQLIYPFYLLFAFNLLALVIIASLVEPERETTIHTGPDPRRMLRYIQSTFWHNRAIFWLTINGSFSGVATFLIVWYSQAYMSLIDLPIIYFGVAWAVFHVVMGSFSLQAARIEAFCGAYRTFFLVAVVTLVSYLALGIFQNVLALFFVGTLYATRGVRTVLIRKHLNQQLSSELRATALSIYSFVFRIEWAVLGPFFGWLADLYSLSTAFLIAGFLLGSILFGTFLMMLRTGSLDHT